MDNSLNHIDLGDKVTAGMVGRPSHEEALVLSGRYKVQCFGVDGDLKWEDEIENTVVTVGKNAALDQILAGTAIGTMYMGLVDGATAPTIAAADTMGSHAGWSENTSYSEASRPTPTWNAAASGSKASNAVTFSINASATVAGCFLATNATKGGTTGTLYSAGTFSGGNKTLGSGDTLSVTYTGTA